MYYHSDIITLPPQLHSEGFAITAKTSVFDVFIILWSYNTYISIDVEYLMVKLRHS